MHVAARLKPLGPDSIHTASLKAIKSRAAGMLAHLRQAASSATLLRAVDDWLGDVGGCDLGFLDQIICGEGHAMSTLEEMQKFAPGDWRWRVLFGHLISRGAHAREMSR